MCKPLKRVTWDTHYKPPVLVLTVQLVELHKNVFSVLCSFGIDVIVKFINKFYI